MAVSSIKPCLGRESTLAKLVINIRSGTDAMLQANTLTEALGSYLKQKRCLKIEAVMRLATWVHLGPSQKENCSLLLVGALSCCACQGLLQPEEQARNKIPKHI